MHIHGCEWFFSHQYRGDVFHAEGFETDMSISSFLLLATIFFIFLSICDREIGMAVRWGGGKDKCVIGELIEE
jgi:hypothetical protein